MLTLEEILDNALNEQQRLAARDTTREILCLACAGSGKSRTLAYRAARLIAGGVDPANIVAFTFTEKAADTIKLRISDALVNCGIDPTVLGRMYIGTIHSYCQYILGMIDARYRQFDVLDGNRFFLYLISRYPALQLGALRNARTTGRTRIKYFDVIKEVANCWEMYNDEMLDLDAIRQHDTVLCDVLVNIRNHLNREEFIDFSSMIRLVVDALRQNQANAVRYARQILYLMVDEYQDINPSQEALIREIHRQGASIFLVGDDDQAIYGWRGATVNEIMTFSNKYPTGSRHTLSHNFRSTQAIVSTSDLFAAQELGAARYPKNPTADDPEGTRDFRVLWFNQRNEEAEWVAERIRALLGTRFFERDGRVRGLTLADFAILMRSTRQPERNDRPRHSAFTEALTRRGIEFTLEAGGGVFERPHVQVLKESFKLLQNNNPDRATVRTFFDGNILPHYPHANFDQVVRVISEWGRVIHQPLGGARRRIYPQKLVYELLEAYGIKESNFPDVVMQDIGVFSRIMQDVETVYMSVDGADRFKEILIFLDNLAEKGYDTETDYAIQRPDAVSVLTVHKAKGLEFPVVFVVDVEAGRFPGRNHNYSGWMPQAVIGDILARGSYRSFPQEEARAFYAAITRAERYLYVSGSENLPGGRKVWRQSPFALRLNHAEILRDVGLPIGILAHPSMRRIDETIVPTTFSELRYYLRCPYDYKLRKVWGFSPAITEMFGFGKTVHTGISKIHEQYAETVPTVENAADIMRMTFHLKHIPPSGNPTTNPGGYERALESAVNIAGQYVQSYADDFTHRRQVEVRFEIPARQTVITGTIDLLLTEDRTGNILDATVIDYKAVEGGDVAENESFDWTELSLQVQLYAKAARQVLGANARRGHVHFLKNNRRQEVPVNEDAVNAAIGNVEWVIDGVLIGDYPQRPHTAKCNKCDFSRLCPKRKDNFQRAEVPPHIRIPGGEKQALSLSEVE